MENLNNNTLEKKLKECPDIEISPKHLRQVTRYLDEAVENCEPPSLRFVVLTCPNYTSSGNVYTFEELSDDVPLLTRLHLEQIEPLLGVLDSEGVAVELAVLMADVAGFDDVLVDKYASGNRAEFLRRCYGSLTAVEAEYALRFQSQYSNLTLTTSSFLTYFEPAFNPFEQAAEESAFFKVRQAYVERIKELAVLNQQSMRYRISNNVRNSREIFKKEYGECKLPAPEVMNQRVITTMAEYLTLGHLVARLPILSTVAIHQGVNVGLLNDRNRIKINTDQVQNELNTPVLILKKKVY